MMSRLSLSRWTFSHSVRMTTAGAAAFASAWALGLPEAVAATVTAMAVTQSNLGGSMKTAVEQILGSLLGAAFGIAVALAVRPGDAAATVLALAVALAPLALLAAHRPGFRIAPITAAIVLLGGSGLGPGPLDLAFERMAGIGVGSGIGLLVSVLVLPARASRSVIDTAERLVDLMGAQVRALASGGAPCQEVLSLNAAEIRENLVRLESLVEDAAHERRARLAGAPDGQRLLRTLRRVRHDINMLRRGAREGGEDAVHDCAAAPWRIAADSAASSLRTIGQVLAGQQPPEGLDSLAAEAQAYRAALEEMRRSRATEALSTAELGRLFGIGFAFDQLRRDLHDLGEIAGQIAASRRPGAAAR